MTERDVTSATGATAAPVEAPAVEPQQQPRPAPEPAIEGEPTAEVPVGAIPPAVPAASSAVPAPTGRPSVRARTRGPLTRMGPWAPVAGALLGVILGAVVAVLLAGGADVFRDRLSLVFLVIGMGLLGASGTLLADEVRLLRWRAREAAVRPAAWVDTTAGLINGLTPARLMLVVAGFVLFLAAYVPAR